MNTQSLILVRGLPGSGKSTLANMLKDSIMLNHDSKLAAVVMEADMYFLTAEGEYRFVEERINSAHIWCELETAQYLNQGCTVIVANTFVKLWEMDAYKRLAQDYNVPLQIIECKGSFGNVHEVPEHTIQKMKASWEEIK